MRKYLVEISSNLLNSPTKLIVLKNSLWLVLDHILRIIFAIFIGSWVARYLGKSDFGQLSFILSFLTLFQIISGLGMDSIVIRELIFKKHFSYKLLGTTFYLKLFTGFICWIISIIFVLIVYGVGDNTYKLVSIAGFSLIFQAFSTFEIWFQSNNKSSYIVIPKLFASFLANLLKILLILNNFPIEYFVIVFSAEFLLSGLFLFYSYTKFSLCKYWVFDLNIAKIILLDSWPFLVSSASIFLYTRIDGFIIKKYLGSEDLGLYSAAVNISAILPTLPMLLFNVINPIVTKKKYENEELYYSLLKKLFRFFTLGGLIFTIIFFLFSDFFINLLYGEEYQISVAILRVHVFTNVFIYSGIAQNFWIINENKGKINLIKTIIGVVCSFAFNIFLIPKYGIIGAAYSAVIVQFISSLVLNFIFAPKLFKLQVTSLFG